MSLDFPAWIRVTHLLNILFLSLLARSGLEILSAHPKLYWNTHCRPGSEWLRFTNKRMPEDRLWTSHDEEESFSSVVALPGHRHLGLGRQWHFASVLGWMLTGVAYVVLLFGTGEWRRLVPTSWSVIPEAWDAFMAYLQFRLPEATAYNGLQQLAYAGVVFVLSPFLIATGAAMSPAIGARFPWFPKLFGGTQWARSLHFLGLVAVVAFTLMHTLMVVVHGLPEGLARVLLGEGTTAILVGIVVLAVIVLLHWAGTAASLQSPRAVQRVLGAIVDPVQGILSRTMSSRQQHDPPDISPFFRVNGHPPESAEYEDMSRDGFAGWRLRIRGQVEEPLSLSLDDLRAMPREDTTTLHHCIQGWSNVGRWTGVPVGQLLDRCRPLPTARYAVFRAMDDKGITTPDIGVEGHYYEVVDLGLLRQPQAILAYEMNDEPLDVAHGAPLRLRLETQLGFKMAKYLSEIELVERYDDIGEGMGGWREDAQQYSREAAI